MVQERQLSQLKLDVCKALRANELVMANIEHPQGLMADRAAASLLNKLAMQNQLLCRIEGAHPGASMEQLSGSKLEPLETNSVEALSLDDVYVASVVATIVEESGAGASGARPHAPPLLATTLLQLLLSASQRRRPLLHPVAQTIQQQWLECTTNSCLLGHK